MRTILCSLASLFVSAAPVVAQDYRSLEGMTVTVKMDMPASSTGVDVDGGSGQADIRKVAALVHDNGIGVHTGESIMITKVEPKGHHVEVQLGGGGWGTFSDRMSLAAASTPVVPYQQKSRYEKDLESDLRWSTNYWDRKETRHELDKARNERNRDNATDAAINAQSAQLAQANARAKAASSGSRFNLRYPAGTPPGLTAQQIMTALGKYVDFNAAPPPARPAEPRSPSGHAPALSKGLTVAQVESILGPASKVSQKTEGSFETTIREYATDNGQAVSAQFVGGVLVDYRITPR